MSILDVTLTGVMPVKLYVVHSTKHVPYISKTSLLKTITTHKPSRLYTAFNERTAFIPYTRMRGWGNQQFYSVANALTYLEYVLPELGIMQRFVMRLIREEYGEFI